MINGQIVIFDEPTESIDEKGRNSIYDLITNLLKNKKTLIIASQDEVILSQANHLIDLDKKPVPKVVTNIKEN